VFGKTERKCSRSVFGVKCKELRGTARCGTLNKKTVETASKKGGDAGEARCEISARCGERPVSVPETRARAWRDGDYPGLSVTDVNVRSLSVADFVLCIGTLLTAFSSQIQHRFSCKFDGNYKRWL
jgi:hypothetical protein